MRPIEATNKLKWPQTLFIYTPDASKVFWKWFWKKLFLTSKIHFFQKISHQKFLSSDRYWWKKLNVWALWARRKFSTCAKVVMWVLETSPTIRAIQRTSIHDRTTRRTKTAPPILNSCNKQTSEAPFQFYLSSFKYALDVQIIFADSWDVNLQDPKVWSW